MLVSISIFVNASITSGGYAACISKTAYEEWMSDLSSDARGRQYLMDNHKCFVLRKGLKYSIVKRIDGYYSSVIRVYMDDGASFKLWTPNDNLK